MSKVIDVDDVLFAMRTAVNRVPEDFVFEGECLYVNEDGEPQCLVAQIVDELGLTLPIYEEFGNQRRVSQRMADDLLWPLTDQALLLLIKAQEEQDGLTNEGRGRQSWRQILLNTVDRAFTMPVSA